MLIWPILAKCAKWPKITVFWNLRKNCSTKFSEIRLKAGPKIVLYDRIVICLKNSIWVKICDHNIEKSKKNFFSEIFPKFCFHFFFKKTHYSPKKMFSFFLPKSSPPKFFFPMFKKMQWSDHNQGNRNSAGTSTYPWVTFFFFLKFHLLKLNGAGSLFHLSLIHIWRCRRYSLCRSRWSPYH